MDKKKYANELLKIAHKNGGDVSRALDDFLDYLLGTFGMDNLMGFDFNYDAVFRDAQKRHEGFFELMCSWIMEVTASMEEGKALDFFGSMYEEVFQGKGKASALGQFYTPQSLCDMMAKMVDCPDAGTFNDCACGSGRTMIAAHMESDRRKLNVYEAGDIDYISCKMCALNFMIHGMVGTVKQQDALLMTTPTVVYHINEVRYPFPTSMYSIRIEHPKERPKPETEHNEKPSGKTEGTVANKGQEPVQLSLDFGT